eukprot:TRINITY_DN57581_c0_g1_i1.p1 TRINITY_DN57581_c0_g1~~TRINITY_DN57581_c0_g1_i1.p1  ORF type:complete len:253 (+),score=9.41 TRINITY_DN57581_c0_g1_i1:35-793(+)
MRRLDRVLLFRQTITQAALVIPMPALVWQSSYVWCSVYIDLAFLFGALLQIDGGHAYSMKCYIKVVVLVALALRLSSRSLRTWSTVYLIILSMLIPPCMYVLLSGRTWRPEYVELTGLLVNRIIEIPLMVAQCFAKLEVNLASQGVEQRRFNRNKVVPLPWLDPHKHVTRTCTWAELCDSYEDANGADKSTLCCICLDDIELNDVVTRLTCNHVFHSQCASRWMMQCAELRRDESVCPMRCTFPETLGASLT